MACWRAKTPGGRGNSQESTEGSQIQHLSSQGLSEAIKTISEPVDINEANQLMPKLDEFGGMSGHSLRMLRGLLNHIYIPLLSVHQLSLTDGGYNGPASIQESRGAYEVRDELLSSAYEFLGVLDETLRHLEEFKLHIPDLDLEGEVEGILSSPVMVEKLEQCVMNWLTQITIVIEEQKRKKPQNTEEDTLKKVGKRTAPAHIHFYGLKTNASEWVPGNGPLAEIYFWRERSAVLLCVTEQLKLPVVKKILDVMIRADSFTVQELEKTIAELSKCCDESDNNIFFLGTLERLFKDLVTGVDFKVVLDTIPDIMNGLRIIWLLSRHYNSVERMTSLMERIAWELSERVARVVNLRVLLKDQRVVAKAKAQDGKQVLDQWKSCYFEVQARIEASDPRSRWEFDDKKLFEKTDYMASICQDLCNVLQTLDEFYILFGPELKAVTGDPKRIDDVLHRVDSLVTPFEELNFHHCDIRKMGSWKMIVQEFKTEEQAIEGEAISFIDQSFKSLRSASAAFDLLLKFKHIRSRDAINNQLMNRFNDIVAQYDKEVDFINDTFVKHKDNPPLIRNQPPVVGAIYWERFLMERITSPIQRFMEMKEMMESEEGKAVKAKYAEVESRMRDYEMQRYLHWKVGPEEALPLLLEKTVLLMVNSDGVVCGDFTKPDTAAQGTARNVEKDVRFIVNFPFELKEIISESIYLDQLGFAISEPARNVALQEEIFVRYVHGLRTIVDHYHSLMDSLNDAEFSLMAEQVQELRKVLNYGCKRLSWNFPKGIPEFIRRGKQAISKIESLMNQIQTNEKGIEDKLKCIESANLFKFPPPDNTGHLPG